MALGISEAAMAASIDWVKQRKIDGSPLADRQGVQWMLADMAVEIEATRLLMLRAAALRQSGENFTRAAAMAKLAASETAAHVTDRALQLHGGYGYLSEYGLEKIVRDLRVHQIVEGTNEIMRLIIARGVVGAGR